MDAYERSLKQQAERIKRELSKEGKVPTPAPKSTPSEEFVPSDVPSPIYGYARPKQKIVLPPEHSPETRQPEEASIEPHTDQNEVSTDEVVELDERVPTGRETATEIEPEKEQPILGGVSIVDDGFSSVFMSSTDLTKKQVEFVEEQPEVEAQQSLDLDTTAEAIGPVVENVAETLQTESEQTELPDDEELTPAVKVSFKADTPPVNVMMTPKDRMAMYRSRRLAENNNNL